MNIPLKNLVRLSIILILVVLPACSSQNASNPAIGSGEQTEGNITISGAFALYPMMTRWAEEFQTIHPDVNFDISAGGAGKGMTDAISGAVDIGMVSREIKPEEIAQGAYGIAVVKDGVFPVVNSQNPVINEILARGISRDQFIKIFITGEITTWGQIIGDPNITAEIHVYTRSDAAGAPEMWAKYLGGVQEDLIGVGINSDPGLLDAVVKDPLGIGYNNLGYAFELSSGQPVTGALLAPIDINGNGSADDDEKIETMSEAINLVASGQYPSPPARPLNLVTKEKPTGIVQAFILWILTDGQQYVGEAGYVQLTQDQLTESLEKIK